MFSSDKWFGASPSFYNGVATQSLRMEYASGVYLNFTPTSTGDQKTWTWSGWIKRTNITHANQYIYTAHSGSNYFAFYFKEGKLASYYGTGSNYGVISDMQFRDMTNWYHIVHQVDAVNTTQRVWVNGTEMSLNSSRNPGNSNYPMNQSSVPMVIGKHSWGSSSFNDMNLAEVNYTDGQKYEASDFGESKNGTWIPIEPSNITYGTNGYRLQFKQTGDGETTASSTTIGADTSGNNNHYKDYNLDSYDSNMPDSPENNFCTLNPLNANDNRGQATFSRGNLRMVSSSSNRGFTTGTMKLHGKVYFEVLSRDGNNGFVGINDINNEVHSGKGQSIDFYGGSPRIDGTVLSDTGTFDDGDIVGVAVDVDAKSIQFFRNNSSVYSGNYTTDAEYFPYLYDSSGGRTMDAVVNFGQDSSFTGEKTSGSANAQDDNNQGDFFYAPPSGGFLALCSANLSDTTLSPNQDEQATDYMGTAIWSGNDTARKISLGFQADWVWTKMRSHSNAHYIFDSSRGDNTSIYSNLTQIEGTGSGRVSFGDSDGFDLGTDAQTNGSGYTYVGWCWKANGGTTTSDTTGSLTVNRQTSSDAGFSIITGTTSNVQANDMTETFGHGLGGTPDFIILKPRSVSYGWSVWTSAISISDVQGLQLNTTGALFTNSSYRTIQATSSVVQIGRQAVENNSTTFVCYAFKEVEGYSKFGTYTGNGNANGTFVYTGFRPAWLMYKRTNTTGGWGMVDNTRDPINEVDNLLNAHDAGAESGTTSTDWDFLSNGFKARNANSNQNYNGSTYIYMAFAEQPFKFSNAR